MTIKNIAKFIGLGIFVSIRAKLIIKPQNN